MEQTLAFGYILDLMSINYGLAGIFANPGFGKTTLMMQIIDEINKRKEGTAIIMSNEAFKREHWMDQMKRRNLSTERIFIDDTPLISHKNIYNHLITFCNIKKEKISIVCVDSLELLDPESIRELRKTGKRNI